MAKNDIICLCHLIGNLYMCISENLIFYFKWYFWNQFASIIAFKFWLAQVSDKQQQVFLLDVTESFGDRDVHVFNSMFI